MCPYSLITVELRCIKVNYSQHVSRRPYSFFGGRTYPSLAESDKIPSMLLLYGHVVAVLPPLISIVLLTKKSAFDYKKKMFGTCRAQLVYI